MAEPRAGSKSTQNRNTSRTTRYLLQHARGAKQIDMASDARHRALLYKFTKQFKTEGSNHCRTLSQLQSVAYICQFTSV